MGEDRTDNHQRCDDGTLLGFPYQTSDRCYKHDSILIQCPQNTYPCNELDEKSDFKEFMCDARDCKRKGGLRQCYADSNGDD